MFRVEWNLAALNDLVAVWAPVDDVAKAAIESVCATLNDRLAADPYQEGESRQDRVRLTVLTPLVFRFRIEEDETTVTVLHVRRLKKRGS